LQSRCGSGSATPALNVAQQGLLKQRHLREPPVPYKRPDKGHRNSVFFPNNQIPTQCFDPVATSPAAVRFRGPVETPAKSLPFQIRGTAGDQFQIKIDSFLQQQSENWRFIITLMMTNTLDPFAKFQAEGSAAGQLSQATLRTRTQQINNVTHTSTIGRERP